MNRLENLHKTLLSILATSSVLYCVVVLAYVATTPDVRLRCLIGETGDAQPGNGISIRATPDLVSCKHYTPEPGDILLEFNQQRIHTFLDFARAQADLRDAKIQTGGYFSANADPEEEANRGSTLSLIEYKDPVSSRFVKIWFRRLSEEQVVFGWLPLHPQPTAGVALSLTWFVLQLAVFIVSGLAYWSRPFDRPVRLFYALCGLALVAYVGGNHWWVIYGRIEFTLPFAVCAILLPAVLLHFFLVYPYPRPPLFRRPAITLTLVYAVPVLTAIAAVVATIVLWILSNLAHGDGPFALLVEDYAGAATAAVVPWLQKGIYLYMAGAAGYFALSIAALIYSYRHTRSANEHDQVKWLLIAAVLAAAPVGYTLFLAFYDRTSFALGASRLPMFAASLLFMVAYTVGVVRYKLMLVDQVLSRGMWYYVVSAGLTLGFSLLVAGAGVALAHEGMSVFGQPALVVVLLSLGVIGFGWVRDRMQRVIDRRFFREKYQLDRALQRINRAVSRLVERTAVGEQMISSCCEALQVGSASLYLRETGDESLFRLASAVGNRSVPRQLRLSQDVRDSLEQGAALQRSPRGGSDVQSLLRELGAELVHGLEMDGEMTGLVALGAKPSGAPYTAEDVTFLNAVGRITGVALHCAKVHEDVTRLNQEMQHKLDKIAEQGRQIDLLQSELASLSMGAEIPASDQEFRREGIRGQSPAIRQVLDTVRKVAASESSVLVRGESGTGKELLARAIHENSPRQGKPLVSVHCGALSPTLLESELFGHVRGAFTDAREDKVGRFELAHSGTLFLDEIGDISLDVQIKLLRVLQERTFEPVGSSRPVQVDVRLIAATHQNLERLIAQGRFREDLYYRLNVISVTLPPLRERRDDIFELALYFLHRAAERTTKRILQISNDAVDALIRYDWPGNIRELQNVIERAVVFAEGEKITLRELSPEVRRGYAPAQFLEAKRLPLHEDASQFVSGGSDNVNAAGDDETEPELLLAALLQCGGNKAEAARHLGMPRSTYYSKLKKYRLG